MNKSSVPRWLLTLVVVAVGAEGFFRDSSCAEVTSPWFCYGGRMLRNAMEQLAAEKSLELMPGVEIVQVQERSDEDRKRDFNEIDDREASVVGSLTRYLTSHELKVNLGEMIRKSEIRNVVRSTLQTVHHELARDFAEARKKDKGGYGAIMMMGVMMSKVLGALGFGGVAMLAMKALGVSMMALLLSAILGLKKLAEGGGDHKGRQNAEFRVSSDEPTVATLGEAAGDGYGDGGYQAVASRHRRSSKDHHHHGHLPYRGWTAVV